MKTAKEIAQWVIDNRYSKSENEKIDDFVMYLSIEEAINRLLSPQASDLKELKDITDEDFLQFIRKQERYSGVEKIKGITHKGNGLFYFYFQMEDGSWIISSLWIDEQIPIGAIMELQSRGYRLPVYFPVQRAETPVNEKDAVEFGRWLGLKNWEWESCHQPDKVYFERNGERKEIADLYQLFLNNKQ